MNKLFRKIVEHEPLTIQEQYLLSVALVELQDQWDKDSSRLTNQFGMMFREAYLDSLDNT